MADEATPLPETAADRVAAARLKQEQREKGIRAQGIQEGRKLERADMLAMVGAQTVEEIGALAPLKQAHTAELARSDARWQREERKHGVGKFWQGFAFGAVTLGALCAAGSAVYALMIVNGTLTAAVPMRAQQQIADQIAEERRAQRP